MSVDVYEIVTNKIIEQLEKGVVPWHKPWFGDTDGAYNASTKKQYSLLNQIILKHQDGYLTYKQANKLGGKVKKGSKSEIVTFWKMVSKDTGEVDDKGQPIEETYPILRYYNVFWIGDIEGLEKLEKPEKTKLEYNGKCEDVINNYLDHNKELKFNNKDLSNEAYYSPSKDVVVVPRIDQFNELSEYYSTSFHELTHSTGHPKRLNRDGIKNITRFGDCDYSKEELVAEMGATMLCNITGIENNNSFQNSAAYLQSWLKALNNDKRMIVSASSRAKKAVEYILNK